MAPAASTIVRDSMPNVSSSVGGGESSSTTNNNNDNSSSADDTKSLGVVSINLGGDDASGTYFTGGDSAFERESEHNSSGVARPEYTDPVVAEKEERAVFWSRLVVIGILSVAVAIMATTMYFIISDSEKADFEDQFTNYASEISNVVQQNAKNTIEAAESFSSTITSYASATKASWPFVTIKDFAARGSRLSSLSNANIITFSPLVDKDDVKAWSNYSIATAPAMYSDSIEFEDITFTTSERLVASLTPSIFGFDFATLTTYDREEGNGPFLPVWQSYPLLPIGVPSTNLDILSLERQNLNYLSSATTKLPSIEFAINIVGNFSSGEYEFVLDSQLFQPVFEQIFNGKRDKNELKVVGMVLLSLDWSSFFKSLLPEGVKGINLVLSSSCSPDVFTYEIDGAEVVPMGPGDLHDTDYDNMKVSAPFVKFDYDESTIPEDICISELRLSLYPTEEFEESFYTNEAIYFTVGVVAIFAFTSLVFCIYDYSVRQRQSKVMARVIRQDRIVSNIFPTAIRDRLYANKRLQDGGDENEHKGDPEGLDIDSDLADGEMFGGAPLAELYPNVTVVFADIAGFTAWSSTREPSQVFALLESIYNAFDKIAYRHSVFKVETVGDCYVAVGGLPEYREDHALVVAKFARDCLHKMGELTKKLEVTLGPDTTDLELRVGLHTGQVTAGVLRGERSRFQLFGDTVNTASRMESTGTRGAIQVSSSTANELKKWKRGKWIQPRKDTVAVKGKGEMQTYWLETREESMRRSKMKSVGSADHRQTSRALLEPLIESTTDEMEEAEDEEEELDDISDDGTTLNTMTKTQRLVEWNVEVLSKLLQQILAARGESHIDQTAKTTSETVSKVEEELKDRAHDGSTTVLDEFKEIVTMPIVNADDLNKRKDPDSVKLPVSAVSQLRDFISLVAEMYRENPFHNFEHASHVTASVRKLLTRIVDADHADKKDQDSELFDLAGHSYGITSDPLTQFAVVFSAIIHDADHPGVPNAQLVKESTRTAQIYKKSIAEQNSVDLVWSLLMTDGYSDLRACIYSNEEELRRFRQLVVNTVMATDIVDKELQALRKARWETAFSDAGVTSSPEVDVNRKATIVIEHLIQASDVSHTMQHWHVYKRWNERFFFELYGSYKEGRAETDPSIGWYKGEIGFFDFYIIPLAKKLKSCGVFGVSSHEYLNYAKANREEWVREGENIVKEYLQKFEMQSQPEMASKRSM